MSRSLTFSFDIGYASIGWAVIASASHDDADPSVCGCGTVLFPKDDCQAAPGAFASIVSADCWFRRKSSRRK